MSVEVGYELRFDAVGMSELFLLPDQAVGKDLTRRCMQVAAVAKRTLSQHGQGRVYQRGGRTHQASAPGQPPAVDTGQLRASVDIGLGVDDLGLFGIVGTPLVKGLWLETGTSRMAARPWLRPSIPAAVL